MRVYAKAAIAGLIAGLLGRLKKPNAGIAGGQRSRRRLLRMAGGLRPPPWHERPSTHKRLAIKWRL